MGGVNTRDIVSPLKTRENIIYSMMYGTLSFISQVTYFNFQIMLNKKILLLS